MILTIIQPKTILIFFCQLFLILQIINILCAISNRFSYNADKIKNQKWHLWEYKILPYYVFKIYPI